MAFALYPELMAILLYVEALEDNEVVFVEDVRQVHRIMTDSNKQKYLEPLDEPRKVDFWNSIKIGVFFLQFCWSLQVSICLMDPEDYSSYPISQFEEDNVLRELNKCLLAFRQNNTCPILPTNTATTQSDRRNNPSPSANGTTGRESKDRERHNSVQRR